MNITYYLGAGASYNAVPIIDELQTAFAKFEVVASNIKLNNISENDLELIKKRDTFKRVMQEACAYSNMYGTIDTYAKKLWLNNEEELIQLKSALSVFFTAWQSVNNISQWVPTNRDNKKDYENIDHRYFGLLTNYLLKHSGELKIPNNVRFITWNYDTQLEMAIKELTNRKYLTEVIKTHSYPGTANNEPTIIHLNGIAGLFNIKNHIQILHDRFKEKDELSSHLQELLFTIDHVEGGNQDLFTYSWEEDVNSKKAIAYAEKIISETDVLVIVGYSFPTFNDPIDRRLLQKFKESSKYGVVYYQDPNADADIIVNRFGFEEQKVRIQVNTDQILLPLEHMNIQMSRKNIEILEAKYGTFTFDDNIPDITVNCTKEIQKIINEGVTQGVVHHATFGISDPNPGNSKEFRLNYKVNDIYKVKSYMEGEMFLID